MKSQPCRSAPIVERRGAGQAPRRFAVRAEFEAIIATMRNLPREAVASWPDLFHTMRRMAGRLDAIAGRLEQTQPVAPRPPSRAPTAGPAASHAAIVAGVFGTSPRLPRQRSRTIVTRRGRSVRVVERSGQVELAL